MDVLQHWQAAAMYASEQRDSLRRTTMTQNITAKMALTVM